MRPTTWIPTRPAAAFLANGALYGSLLTRYPQIADQVHAGNAGFGLALFASALGGLSGSLVSRWFVGRLGEVVSTVVTGSGYAVLALGIVLADRLPLLALAFFVTGLFDGAHDVAMNALGAREQQRVGEPIFGRLHAMWSIGLAAAGLVGVGAVAVHVPIMAHVGVFVAVALGLHLYVLRGRSDVPRVTPDLVEAPRDHAAAATTRRAVRAPLLLLGLAAFAASYVESPGQEWTGVLLGRGLHSSGELAAAAPVLFAIGLGVSRLGLDAGIVRFGAATMARVSALVVMVAMGAGLVVAALDASPYLALVAVAVGGVGAGPAFPLLFGAADGIAARFGTAPATTAATISALSRTGAISAPLLLGVLTEAVGLPVVFVVMAAGGAVMGVALPLGLRLGNRRPPAAGPTPPVALTAGG